MRTPEKSFRESSRQVTQRLDYRQWMQQGLRGYQKTREETQSHYLDWPAGRQAAANVKWDTIEHLDQYLEEFSNRLEERGSQVFWASTGADACRYIIEVAKRHNAKMIVKSKSMTTEEIHLNEALAGEGFRVVESDLGEYIVQLRGEVPYHFVFPAMHLRCGEISQLFNNALGSTPTDDPEELTMIARRALREVFCQADIGISGANFGIAETGMISITENEGNARLSTGLPRIHIAVMGIEKILPKLEHLALFLPLLAAAGTGQALTCYNSMLSGPRRRGEPDGPEEFHVILLDNQRTRLLADPEQRDALRCIRCGACLNVCPIFKNVGGHSYGTTYQGPIGSVITPHLRGLQSWKHLPFASSLCGACTETCPVQINLHHHLLHLRRDAMSQRPNYLERFLLRIFALIMRSPMLYRLLGRMLRLSQPIIRLTQGSVIDPLKPWTRTRRFPELAPTTFKQY
jgi:L-lactate dehydrogenase complex protein LldF